MNQYPNQSNPYNNPTTPNPGQYYTSPPPPPVSRRKRLWRWYRNQHTRTQWGLGCGVIIAALFLCMCSTAIAAPGASQSASSPTPTTQAQVIAPTTTHTTKPTQVPTPTRIPTPTPTPAPTQPPAPTPRPTTNPCPNAVNENPWCYDFNQGSFIYNPPANFCSYFACIASFWNGRGYVEECQDGDYSKSGGIQGSCSHHGGNLRPLYSH